MAHVILQTTAHLFVKCVDLFRICLSLESASHLKNVYISFVALLFASVSFYNTS